MPRAASRCEHPGQTRRLLKPHDTPEPRCGLAWSGACAFDKPPGPMTAEAEMEPGAWALALSRSRSLPLSFSMWDTFFFFWGQRGTGDVDSWGTTQRLVTCRPDTRRSPALPGSPAAAAFSAPAFSASPPQPQPQSHSRSRRLVCQARRLLLASGAGAPIHPPSHPLGGASANSPPSAGPCPRFALPTATAHGHDPRPTSKRISQPR